MKTVKVSFPGNLKVQADLGDFSISTDQPKQSGGDDTAPSPFALFVTSLATCAGYFALKFCRTRKIDTEGLAVNLNYEWDEEQKRYPEMEILLTLPEGFPEKYRNAIKKAVDQCVVKQHIVKPPEFILTITN